MTYYRKNQDGTVTKLTLAVADGVFVESITEEELGPVSPDTLVDHAFVQQRNKDLNQQQEDLGAFHQASYARRRGYAVERRDGKLIIRPSNRDLVVRDDVILHAFDPRTVLPENSAAAVVRASLDAAMRADNIDCEDCARNQYVRKMYDAMDAALVKDGKLPPR